MGYYLLDNPNPHGDHYYETRRKPLRVIVLHVTASVEDQDMRGADASAEQTARYAATTKREVSWHAGADSDSWLPLLPPDHTAWHVRGYNSLSWGLEISKRDVSWSDEPPEWVEATLFHAANACRPIAQQYDIPLRRLTKAQVDAGMFGFAYHSDLDPERRFDPGDDFPVNRFFELVEDGMALSDDDINRLADALLRKERIAKWAPGDENSDDTLTLGMTANQSRGYSEQTFLDGRRLLRMVSSMSRALAALAETLPADVRDVVRTELEAAIESGMTLEGDVDITIGGSNETQADNTNS